MQMKYDKERRDEVYAILADMNSNVLTKEEGEERLRSFSPQLVNMVRESQGKNWKASFNVKDMVRGNTAGDMTKKAVIGRFLVMALGCYTVFAGATLSLAEARLGIEQQGFDYARIGIGLLGIILGMLTLKLLKIGTLFCGGWAAAVWYYFPIWIVPVPVFGIMLFGFIFQCIVQKGKQIRTPVLGLTGIFFSIGLLVNAFLSELFYKKTDVVKIDTSLKITEKLPDTINVNYLFGGAGVLVLVLGIIFLVRSVRKSAEEEKTAANS